METFVEGVRITLTTEQEAQVKKVRGQRQRCRNSFTKILKHFGFKKMKGTTKSFHNETFNWYAEIQDFGNWNEVFMAGKGLKHSSMPPGGWMYGNPKEIEEALLSAMQNI